jgi:hypothetical protein
MYKGQWKKRCAYYRQCAYKMEQWAMKGEKPLIVKSVKEKEIKECLID